MKGGLVLSCTSVPLDATPAYHCLLDESLCVQPNPETEKTIFGGLGVHGVLIWN